LFRSDFQRFNALLFELKNVDDSGHVMRGFRTTNEAETQSFSNALRTTIFGMCFD